MDVSIRQLRMLREVANQGTIAAAAEQLGFTPSAVSQQLGLLEKSLGVAVLERIGRNVRLTDSGSELVVHAGVVISQLEKAEAAIEQVQVGVSGELHLGLIESVAATILPQMMPILEERYPKLALRTLQTEAAASLEAVRSGELDATFIIGYPGAPGPQADDVKQTLLCRDWFHIVVQEDDEITDSVIDLADLQNRHLVASPPTMLCGRCVLFACRDAGFEPNIVHQIDDYPTVLRLVAAGAGVGMVPDLGLRQLPDGIRVVDLKSPVCRTIEIAYRASSADRPSIKGLLQVIFESAEALGLEPENLDC